MSSTTFAALLRELVQDWGGPKSSFARAIQISPSRLSHALAGTDHFTVGIELCLRIARATGMSPSRVLRAAGKGEVADLIEELYGKAVPRPTFTQQGHRRLEQERHWDLWQSIDPRAQRALTVLLEQAAAASSPPTARRARA